MTIYSKTRTSSYSYRKIYEQHYGKIPIDDTGRTYEIHHIDGDTENNDPSNLVALTIEDHFAIHKSQGDSKACLAIAARMEISAEEKKHLASLANSGDKNPSYGSKWWNNGVIEVRTRRKPKGDEWVSGRFGIGSKINSTKTINGTHPSGSKNGRYDHRIHTFINTVTHEVVVSTQYDFRISRNMRRRSVNKLVDGSLATYDGWILSNLS